MFLKTNSKYLSLLLSLVFSFFHAQQDKIDSLNLVLKRATHDTTKCNLLVQLIESTADDNIWPKYNEQLISLTENKIKSTKKNSSEYIFYLNKYAEALGNIGYIAQIHGDLDKSIEYYEKGLKIQEETKNLSGIAISCHNIGSAYITKGDLASALKYTFKSLEIYTKIKDKIGTSYIYNDLGTIYDLQGNISKSLEYYNKCLKICEETNDKILASQALNNIANTFVSQGIVDKALEYYQKGLTIREKIGDKRGAAQTLTGIGGIYFNQGKFDLALEFYNKSLILKKEVDDKQGIAYNYFYMAEVFFKKGEKEKSKEYYNKSLEINEEIGYKLGIAGSLNRVGEIFLEEKNYKAAEEYLKKSISISKEIGVPERIADAARCLYQTYIAMNKPQLALDNYKLYIQMRDSVNGLESQKAGIKLQAQFEYEKQKALSDKEHQMQINRQKEVADSEAKKQKIVILFTGVILLVVIVFSLFLYKRFKLTQKQKQLIEAKEKETQEQKLLLEERHKEITDSINYAKNIQDAFMPNEDIFYRLFENSFLFFKPKDVVSGDFYWFYSIHNGDFISSVKHIAVADCTGHGVPGALMSLICSNALNEAVVQNKIYETDEILNEARKVVKRSLKTRKFQERKDGMDISLISINFETLELWYSGANNPAWVLHEGKIIELNPDKQPVGLYEVEKDFTKKYLKLVKGDIIYLFSDGYADQFGGPKGKKFKYKQLSELLLSIAYLSMSAQKEKIETAFNSWKRDLEQIDDVTVLGIKV